MATSQVRTDIQQFIPQPAHQEFLVIFDPILNPFCIISGPRLRLQGQLGLGHNNRGAGENAPISLKPTVVSNVINSTQLASPCTSQPTHHGLIQQINSPRFPSKAAGWTGVKVASDSERGLGQIRLRPMSSKNAPEGCHTGPVDCGVL